MKNTLQEEQAYYDTHKKEIISKYLGKEVVITNKIEGAFNTFSDAVDYTVEKNLTPGKFMIKKVVVNEPVYAYVPVMIQVAGDE